ncbi:hypothetical protein ABZ477_16210 [Microbacterium sp. NPDC019599]
MTDAPRIVSVDLTHLVRAALAAEAAEGPSAVDRSKRDDTSPAEVEL